MIVLWIVLGFAAVVAILAAANSRVRERPPYGQTDYAAVDDGPFPDVAPAPDSSVGDEAYSSYHAFMAEHEPGGLTSGSARSD